MEDWVVVSSGVVSRAYASYRPRLAEAIEETVKEFDPSVQRWVARELAKKRIPVDDYPLLGLYVSACSTLGDLTPLSYREARTAAVKNWVYLNGRVEFSDRPFEGLRALAQGEQNQEANALANHWLAGNQIIPHGHKDAIAMGELTPDGHVLILNTNIDRNKVRDAVLKQRTAAGIGPIQKSPFGPSPWSQDGQGKLWTIGIGNTNAEEFMQWITANAPRMIQFMQVNDTTGVFEGSPETAVSVKLFDTPLSTVKKLLDMYGQHHPEEYGFGLEWNGKSQVYRNKFNHGLAAPGNLDKEADARPPKQDFFNDVIRGKDIYAPAKRLELEFGHPGLQQTYETMLKHKGPFGAHIETSIPHFRPHMVDRTHALAKAFGNGPARHLDIGGSEGYIGKTLSELTNGNIESVNVDPAQGMHDFFHQHSQAPNAHHVLEAFGGDGWVEDDGTVIKPHQPKEPYDIITEGVTFQFMGNDRNAQVQHAKSMLRPGGIFVSEEKFRDDPREAEHEARKDQWKSQFYTPEQLSHKETVVGIQDAEREAIGMRDMMVNHNDYENILRSHFPHVAQVWSSGNFKGYVASDHPETLNRFLQHYQGVGNDPDFQAEPVPRKIGGTLSKKALADHNGSMVALDVPAEYHNALAVKGGEPAKDLHVTLAYLPEGVQNTSGVASMLNDIATKFGPAQGTIKKFDQFPETDDKDIPHIATLEGDQLHELATAVRAGLKGLGENVSEKHDFKPHITVKYAQPDEEFEHPNAEALKDMPLTFPAIHLHQAGDVQEFPFNGRS